jgi:hypothetical protein
LDCLWLIEVENNFVIWFVFTDFDLNFIRNCDNNFVKVSTLLQGRTGTLEEKSMFGCALGIVFGISYIVSKRKKL